MPVQDPPRMGPASMAATRSSVTDPLTPALAEGQIQRVLDELEERSQALVGLLAAEASTKAEYKIAYAQSLVQIKADYSEVPTRERPSAETREAMVLCNPNVQQKFRAHLVAEAAADGCRERVRALRDEMSGVTSLNASVRLLAGG